MAKQADKKGPGTQVTDPKKTAMAVRNEQFAADADHGFEEADKDAYAIPFLAILQSGSPQVKKSDGKYIKGAEEGMIFNTVTGEIFSGEDGKGVEVIPCYFTQRFTRWGARDAGGGFKGEYLSTDPELKKARGEGGIEIGKAGQRFFPDGKGKFEKKTSDILNDTRNHYVLVKGKAGILSPAVVSMTSTQIRHSKNWMAKMRNYTGIGKDGHVFIMPMCSHSFDLMTTPEQNDQGSWYGWKIELVGDVDMNSPEYGAAKALAKSVSSGALKPVTPENPDQE